MTNKVQTYEELMSDLTAKVLNSKETDQRHDAIKKAYVATAVKKVSEETNAAKTLQPFNGEIVAVCLDFQKTMLEFEPVEMKDHEEKLSKPKQKTKRRLEFWNVTDEAEADQLTKHAGVFFTSALKVAELATYAEEIVSDEKSRIHSLQVLANKAVDAKKAADKKAKAAADKQADDTNDDDETDNTKTPEALREAVQAAIVRLWQAAEAASYDKDEIIRLVTEAAPKPEADATTDKLNALRGKTDRTIVKADADKITGKAKAKAKAKVEVEVKKAS
jgi:hypothetical protein